MIQFRKINKGAMTPNSGRYFLIDEDGIVSVVIAQNKLTNKEHFCHRENTPFFVV
jgi:hypothetical protein